jgi:porphobilinogen synthase
MGFPQTRMRRLRQTPSLRKMLAAPAIPPARLIYPIFLVDGKKRREPIASMAGQARVSIDLVEKELARAAEAGVGGFLFFGVPEDKDAKGSGAFRDDGLIQKAVRVAAKAYPDQVLFTDVCLCEYTDHGHCGIMKGKELDNDLSIEALGRMAVSHAAAGAHVVAPSAMMDGQVGAIRRALDGAGSKNTLILSYSTKFASALYGPFREAAKSAPAFGDRRGYQAPYDDVNQAIRESLLDEAEGADMLMVKPSMFYLDVIQRLREKTLLPIAAYHVSGEYAMLHAAAEKGYGDLSGMIREAAYALRRAGTDFIICYWAPEWRKHLGQS